jgi:murein L,D-transpeptidase YafK
MARHRNNHNIPFWKMLKEGYDHFEVTRMEPKVDVCAGRYVFNARPNFSATFNQIEACAAYEVPPQIASAVATKQQQDELKTAELVGRGTPEAPIRANSDGGMHAIFLARVKPSVRDSGGN